MITAPAGVAFRSLVIPKSMDAPEAADFTEMVRVRNIVYRQISGRDDNDITADELLPFYQPDEYELRFVWSVVKDDAVVGRIGVDIPLEGGSKALYWLIELQREVWGQGIGSAAYEFVEQVAR